MKENWHIDEESMLLWQNWESWTGSYYELSVRYERSSLDSLARVQLSQCLWNDPALVGIVNSPLEYGQSWKPIREEYIRGSAKLYGGARLSTGDVANCASFFIDSQDEIQFTFFFPLAGLGYLFPISYPLRKETNPWMHLIDLFLVELGMRLYKTQPFLYTDPVCQDKNWRVSKRILLSLQLVSSREEGPLFLSAHLKACSSRFA